MSSAAWTLHVAPFASRGDPEALERADLVRDGFSWGAFLVPMLWFFSHRHWLLGLGALVVVVGFGLALKAIGAGPPTILAAEILLHLLIGFEGPTLRRWAYARAGRPAVDAVAASDLAEAETKTFARWLAPVAPSWPGPRPPRLPLAVRRADEPPIGLFPDLEGRP